MLAQFLESKELSENVFCRRVSINAIKLFLPEVQSLKSMHNFSGWYLISYQHILYPPKFNHLPCVIAFQTIILETESMCYTKENILWLECEDTKINMAFNVY